LGIVVPVSLGVVALLALLLVWVYAHRGGEPAKSTLNVSARVISNPGPDAAPSTPAPAPEQEPVPVGKPAIAAETSVPPADRNAAGLASGAPTELRTNLAVPAITTSEPNPAPGAESASAAAPLKLQGIVFNPKRPSALINGRVMFVGERIRDLRIIAIRPDSVVLSGNSRTNVLSLEP